LADWLAETCANPSYAFILNLNYSLPAQQSDSEAGKGSKNNKKAKEKIEQLKKESHHARFSCSIFFF